MSRPRNLFPGGRIGHDQANLLGSLLVTQFQPAVVARDCVEHKLDVRLGAN